MIVLNNRKPKSPARQMRQGKALTEAQRAEIVARSKDRQGAEAIAHAVGCSAWTVLNVRKQEGVSEQAPRGPKRKRRRTDAPPLNELAPILMRINSLRGAEKRALQMRLAAFHRGELPWADVDPPADGISARRLGEVA